jgi:hypothetical protein
MYGTYGRSILEDLRLAEEAGMVFPEAAAAEVEAEVKELEALSTAQLREKGKVLGVVPVGDKCKAEVWKRGLRAARGAVQQAAVTAAAAVAAAHASAAGATATALAAAEARPKRVRKLSPSDGWQTAPAAVARRVVEDGQEGAAADEAVVLEEDLSDEEADSAGPVKWVVPAWRYWQRTEGGGGQG